MQHEMKIVVCKVWITLVMSSGLFYRTGRGKQHRKSVLQTEIVEFERSGHLIDKEILMTDTTELHYGRCVWSLTYRY